METRTATAPRRADERAEVADASAADAAARVGLTDLSASVSRSSNWHMRRSCRGSSTYPRTSCSLVLRPPP